MESDRNYALRNHALNDRSWYVATLDLGIYSGPFRTKRLAMNHTDMTMHLTSMHRSSAGLYHAPVSNGRTAYVGTGRKLRISGFNQE